MSSPVAVVVGLGNPGPRYAETRHNAGFWLVDRLAAAAGATFRMAGRFNGEVADLRTPPCRLLKPATFMNHSGQAVAAFMAYYRLEAERLLVVHDEIDLPPGAARLKRGGGHGGHNGLRDIMAALGARDFYRLRIGVGHPGHRDAVVSYVLQRPSRDEAAAMDDAIARAIKVMPLALDGAWERAMHALHTVE